MDFAISPYNKSIAGKYSELIGSHALLYEETEALRIMIMGEFNAGKSSVCNALLGRPILPTDIFQTTATINRLRYGIREEYRVIGHDDKIIFKDSNLETLIKFNADCGSFRNVKWIEIFSPLIPQWIEYIDTPGFNDTDEDRNETFLSIAPTADVIIFVCDANQALKGTELPYINKFFLSSLTRVYFLFNHADGCRSLPVLTITYDSVNSTIKEMIDVSIEKFKSGQFNEMAEKLNKIELSKRIYFISAMLSLNGVLPDVADIELIQKLKDEFNRFKAELYSLIEKKDMIRRQSQIRLLSLQLEGRLSEVNKMLEIMNLSDKQNKRLKDSLRTRLTRQEQNYLIIQKRLLDLPRLVGEFIDKGCDKILANLSVTLRGHGDDTGNWYINERYQEELQVGLKEINAGVTTMIQNEIHASFGISLMDKELYIGKINIPSLTQRNEEFQKQMIFAGFAGTIGLTMGLPGFIIGSVIGAGISFLAVIKQRRNRDKVYKNILDETAAALKRMRNEAVDNMQSSMGKIQEEILKSTDNIQWNVMELSEFSINSDPEKQLNMFNSLKSKLELAIKDCRIQLVQLSQD